MDILWRIAFKAIRAGMRALETEEQRRRREAREQVTGCFVLAAVALLGSWCVYAVFLSPDSSETGQNPALTEQRRTDKPREDPEPVRGTRSGTANSPEVQTKRHFTSLRQVLEEMPPELNSARARSWDHTVRSNDRDWLAANVVGSAVDLSLDLANCRVHSVPERIVHWYVSCVFYEASFEYAGQRYSGRVSSTPAPGEPFNATGGAMPTVTFEGDQQLVKRLQGLPSGTKLRVKGVIEAIDIEPKMRSEVFGNPPAKPGVSSDPPATAKISVKLRNTELLEQ